MITDALKSVSAIERSQFERIELARGSWATGQIENALLILESVKGERMSAPVAAECFVAEAAFRIDAGDRDGSMQSLTKAAPYIDHATLSVQGAFYHQRGRINKEAGNLDAAFTDYAGAEACWREIGASEKLGAVVLNLAGLSLKLGDLTRAHQYALNAIDIFTQNDSFYISQAYDTQAQIYLAEGKIRAALESINLALSLVGENNHWQKEFLETKDRIVAAIIDLIKAAGHNLSSIQKEMVRRALIKHNGNLTRASKDIGMSRKGMSYVVDQNEDLESLRVERRVRRKSIIK